MAASVAHEVRNPLTAVKMWLFSIRESASGNRDLERKLAIVSEEITRLEGIVREFLEFSRPPALKCQPQSPVALVQRTLEVLEPKLRHASIQIEQDFPAALPPILADAEQVRQVLLNLLGNAFEAMPQGGRLRLSGTAQPDAEGQPMVVLRVHDSGPGMTLETQRRIFEPFFTTKQQGTGLGLWIAGQIMARHAGRLVLDSSTAQGTVFAVWLPVAKGNEDGQNPGRG